MIADRSRHHGEDVPAGIRRIGIYADRCSHFVIEVIVQIDLLGNRRSSVVDVVHIVQDLTNN